MSDAIDGVCVHGCSRFYLINKSQEICLHVFRTVEKIIREPGLVRSTGSAVIYFYIIFSAFFEFVVLAVYVAARNFWHIAPFLSYYVICVLSSLPLPARRYVSFTICRIFYPEKHKCRCMRQRHLNKERNFSAANLSYASYASERFLFLISYIQYTRFSGVRKFLSDFLTATKKRLAALFQIRKLFSFVLFLMYSRAYALALIISAASICGINLSIVLAVMISFFRN